MLTSTVLTVNTHKGFAALNRRFVLPELRDAVRTTGADIVFLQEVLGAHERHSRRVPGFPAAPHYEFLADEMWPQYAYGRNAVYPDGHHGNAILSKYPIVKHENRDIPAFGHEPRGLLHCVLQLPKRDARLHAICVHLGLLERHRQRQLDLLCAMVENEIPRDAPLVIAGDFNDWRERGHARLAGCAGLTEVFATQLGRAARTFPARRPLLRLDRIYVRHVAVEQRSVLSMRPWSHLSDHAALSARLAL